MEKQGKVTKLTGDFAEITVIRDSACGENCKACGLCSNSREMTITLRNTKNLSVGDAVRLSSDDKKILSYSAAGYLSLTALLIAGGVIGGIIGGDWAAFLGAILGTFLGVFVLKHFFVKAPEIELEKIEENQC